MNPTLHTDEDVGIVKLAQSGSTRAFNKLFYKYRDMVYKILYSYIKDEDEAKDQVNVVFMKVYRKLSSFTDYSSFGGWLRRISERVAVDYLRRNKKRREKFVPETSDEGLSLDVFGKDIENEVVNHLTYLEIIKRFDKFSKKNKRILELFFEDNMTIAQISETLEIPTGTIKSVLSRARKKIRL